MNPKTRTWIWCLTGLAGGGVLGMVSFLWAGSHQRLETFADIRLSAPTVVRQADRYTTVTVTLDPRTAIPEVAYFANPDLWANLQLRRVGETAVARGAGGGWCGTGLRPIPLAAPVSFPMVLYVEGLAAGNYELTASVRAMRWKPDYESKWVNLDSVAMAGLGSTSTILIEVRQ